MRVYSPSSTSTWEQCPYRWKLEQEGWRPRTTETRHLAAMAGTVFSLLMERFNRASQCAQENPVVTEEGVLQELQSIYQPLVNAGAILAPDMNEESLLSTYARHLFDSYHFTILNNPTPPEWEIVSVEQPLEVAGWARPDVVYSIPGQVKYVRDYKFKLKLDKRFETDNLKRYLNSTQALHYLYFVPARYFNPLIVVATPKPHFVGVGVVREMDVDERARWFESSRGKWAVMKGQETGNIPYWEAESHDTPFGPCPFTDACLQYDRDPARMQVGGYIQVMHPRRSL